MIYFIPNILSKEECVFLSKQFDIEKVNNSSSDKMVETNASFGFRPSYNFDKYMEKLKPKVLEFNNGIEHLDNVNTYVREYFNGAFLTKHIDRTDISVTISICLESTINKAWPLCANFNNKEYGIWCIAENFLSVVAKDSTSSSFSKSIKYPLVSSNGNEFKKR